MQYSFKENTGFSANIPTVTDAGTYTIYYKVFGGKNYNDSQTESLEVIIKKAFPEVETPGVITAGIGQYLSEVELPANWSWIENSTFLDTLGLHHFDAIYTPTDTKNYFPVGKVIGVAVIKSSLTDSEIDNFYMFNVELENSPENCNVYAATYDEKGVLLSVQSEPLATDGSTIIMVGKSENDLKAKIFVWSDTMQPILEQAA